jgi:hypothetical protein
MTFFNLHFSPSFCHFLPLKSPTLNVSKCSVYSSIFLIRNAWVRKSFGFWILSDFGTSLLYAFIMHKNSWKASMKNLNYMLMLLDCWSCYTKLGIWGDDEIKHYVRCEVLGGVGKGTSTQTSSLWRGTLEAEDGLEVDALEVTMNHAEWLCITEKTFQCLPLMQLEKTFGYQSISISEFRKRYTELYKPISTSNFV